MLELSKAVQRIIDVERKANDDLREELAAAKAALAAKEQALSAGKVSRSRSNVSASAFCLLS